MLKLILAAVVGAIALFIGERAWYWIMITPAGPASGRPTFVATRPAPATLRVAQWNIHRGLGTDQVRDFNRIADHLHGFDLIALNEISQFNEPNDAEFLGRKLNLHALCFPREWSMSKIEVGDGLLTAFPVDHFKTFTLHQSREAGYRILTLCRVRVGEQVINVLITHIDRKPADHDHQLDSALQTFRSLQPPALLMGDLNSMASSRLMKEILSEPDVVEPFRILNVETEETRIDWILARGLHPLRAGTTPRGPSDHPMFWVEFQMPGK
jgi:endonuclease/exonuclease/phosphatase family metal-dependent hydrolase